MRLRNSIELIFYKTYTDLKAESERSYLGFLWWIIEPIFYLSAFYILQVLVMRRDGTDFVPFFLCGAVVWKWFDSGVKGGGHAISIHRGLLQQVYVQKFVFPVITVMGSTARFIPVFGIFCLFLLLYGTPVKITWLAAPLLFATQLCLTLSLALLISSITPFLPDLKVAIDNAMLLLFFISGVFFNINEVHEPVRSYLLVNPMAGLIDEYRNIMLRGAWPNLDRIGIIILTSLGMGGLGLALLKQLDHKYGKIPF
ncbi:ABC transporter permease [Methylobacter sp. BBA5.1]|uniref:ABC transporter permease n=1 Tax=Methylobacter sp. BBA5.1 TaxID=1495064 RepID=UPI00068D9BB9|nr:ABC transporter permease [Methylobacter sp. BBA5.1]